jgi:putative phosphoesterase
VRVGLVSDTHGLLRDEALEFLRGSDHIVHGGDIGDRRILEALAALAPVTAVRGNNDAGEWACHLPEAALLTVQQVRIFVIHEAALAARDPAAAGAAVVVTGHSHRPRVELRDGTWHVNPGSAGPRRFKLPVSVGELLVDGPRVTARVVEFDIGRKTA